MDGTGTLSIALGGSPVAWDPSLIEPNLWAMVMRTDKSLQEYLRIHLRLSMIPDIRPLASTFDFVADAAPGVKEVLAVGKVCWEVKQNHYDLVVVDAEASGHVVAQIASPRTINSLVPRGPLRDQTRWMLDILDDPLTCGVVVVSTPEELPVTESVELIARLGAETRTNVAAVVVNALEPQVPAQALDLASDPWFESVAPAHATSVKVAAQRVASQQENTRPLREVGATVLELPVVSGSEHEIVEQLSAVVEGWVR